MLTAEEELELTIALKKDGDLAAKARDYGAFARGARGEGYMGYSLPFDLIQEGNGANEGCEGFNPDVGVRGHFCCTGLKQKFTNIFYVTGV